MEQPKKAWIIHTKDQLDWCLDQYEKERAEQQKAKRSGNQFKERVHRMSARNLLNKLLNYHMRN